MSGILDNVRCDCLEGDKRNSVAAAVAGALVYCLQIINFLGK